MKLIKEWIKKHKIITVIVIIYIISIIVSAITGNRDVYLVLGRLTGIGIAIKIIHYLMNHKKMKQVKDGK
jgi:hypothetical protein